MRGLTSDLLDVARIRPGRLSASPAPNPSSEVLPSQGEMLMLGAQTEIVAEGLEHSGAPAQSLHRLTAATHRQVRRFL